MSNQDDLLAAKYGVRTHHTSSAYRAIREAIISGRLDPGQQLNERALAKESGFSRTPVRHALARLTAEGLAEQIPHVGTFVRKLTLEETADLVEFRRGLESGCAAMAATGITPEQAVELRELADRLAASDRRLLTTSENGNEQVEAPRNRALELRFHHRVAELSGCEAMIAAVENASAICLALFPQSVRRPSPDQADHVRVARAIGDGDPYQAFRAMWDHFHTLLQWLGSQSDAPQPRAPVATAASLREPMS